MSSRVSRVAKLLENATGAAAHQPHFPAPLMNATNGQEFQEKIMGRKKHFPAPLMNATNGQKISGTNNGKKKHFPAPSWSLPFRCLDVRLFLPKGGAVPSPLLQQKNMEQTK